MSSAAFIILVPKLNVEENESTNLVFSWFQTITFMQAVLKYA